MVITRSSFENPPPRSSNSKKRSKRKAGSKRSNLAVVTRRNGNVQIVNRHTGRIVSERTSSGKSVVRIAVSTRGKGGTPVRTQRQQARVSQQAKLQTFQPVRTMREAQRVANAQLEKKRREERRINAFARVTPSGRATTKTEELARSQLLAEQLRKSKVVSPSFRRGLGVFTQAEEKQLSSQIKSLTSNTASTFVKELEQAKKRNIATDKKIVAIENIIRKKYPAFSILPPSARKSFAQKVATELVVLTATTLTRLGASATYGVDTARIIIKNKFKGNARNQASANRFLERLNKNKGTLTKDIAINMAKSFDPRTPEGVANILFTVILLGSGAKSGKSVASASVPKRILFKALTKGLRKPTVKNFVRNYINTNTLTRLIKKQSKLKGLKTTAKKGFPTKKTRISVKESVKPLVKARISKEISSIVQSPVFKKSGKAINNVYSSLKSARERALFTKELLKLRVSFQRQLNNQKFNRIINKHLKSRLKNIQKTFREASIPSKLLIQQLKISRQLIIHKINIRLNKLLISLSKAIPKLSLSNRLTKIKSFFNKVLREFKTFFSDPILNKFIQDQIKRVKTKQFKLKMKTRRLKKRLSKKKLVVKSKVSRGKVLVKRAIKRPVIKLRNNVKARLSRLKVPRYVIEGFNKVNIKRYLRSYEKRIDIQIRKEISKAKTVNRKRFLRASRKRFKQNVDNLLNPSVLDNIVVNPRSFATKLSRIKEAEKLLSAGAISITGSKPVRVVSLSLDSKGVPKMSIAKPSARVRTASDILKVSKNKGGRVQSTRQVLLLKQRVKSVTKPQVTKNKVIVKTKKGILKIPRSSSLGKNLLRYTALSLAIKNARITGNTRYVIPKTFFVLDSKVGNIFRNVQSSAQLRKLGQTQGQTQAQGLKSSQVLRLRSVLVRAKVKPPQRLKAILSLPKRKLSNSDKDFLNKFVMKVGKRYRPSLASLILNITSYKIPKRITGFEIRPIIIRRKRKRRK